MQTSVIADIVAEQTDLPMRQVRIRQITQTMLAADLRAGDEPIVLCDAFTEQHLADIAEAAAEVHRRDGTVWVSADPGPSGALLAYALRLRGEAGSRGPLLGVVGSATEVTRRQLDALARTGPVRFVDIDAARFGDTDDAHRGEVARDLTRHLTTAVFPEVVVLRLASSAEDVRELPELDRRELPHLIADLVSETVRGVGHEFGAHALPSGLYTSGGDVTSAVLDELGVHAFEAGGEVVPLAVHGVLSGGPLDGMPITTKGGLVGDDSTITECVAKLRRAVQTRLRQVPSEVSEHVLVGGAPPHTGPR